MAGYIVLAEKHTPGSLVQTRLLSAVCKVVKEAWVLSGLAGRVTQKEQSPNAGGNPAAKHSMRQYLLMD